MQSIDSKCGDVVYDGTKKGDHIPHSLDSPEVFHKDLAECLKLVKQAYDRAYELTAVPALYKFTVAETGETWTGPMPESSSIPNAKITIGIPATEKLVKVGDAWVIRRAPFTTATVKEAFEEHHELRADLTVVKQVK